MPVEKSKIRRRPGPGQDPALLAVLQGTAANASLAATSYSYGLSLEALHKHLVFKATSLLAPYAHQRRQWTSIQDALP